jgi:hypothetical protein
MCRVPRIQKYLSNILHKKYINGYYKRLSEDELWLPLASFGCLLLLSYTIHLAEAEDNDCPETAKKEEGRAMYGGGAANNQTGAETLGD